MKHLLLHAVPATPDNPFDFRVQIKRSADQFGLSHEFVKTRGGDVIATLGDGIKTGGTKALYYSADSLEQMAAACDYLKARDIISWIEVIDVTKFGIRSYAI